MKDWTPRRISFDPSLTLSRNEIFILSRVEESSAPAHAPPVLTGWETVVFELEDITPEDDGGGSIRRSGFPPRG